jgi:uncharacterized protein YqeY
MGDVARGPDRRLAGTAIGARPPVREVSSDRVMTTVTEQLRADTTVAMKAGEKQRVTALRLVLSELQKAAKDGSGDELTVLRRERKRRLEAAEQFRDNGRPDLADQEQSEAELISGYLPAELSDEDLDALVAQAITDTGAAGPKDMGRVMKAVTAASEGRADGRRASASVRQALARTVGAPQTGTTQADTAEATSA